VLKILFKNYLWLLIEFLFKNFIMLASTLLVLNNLDVNQYGNISIINNFTLFIFPFLYFGSKSIYLLEFSKENNKENVRLFYNDALSVRILISLIYSSILFLLYINNSIPLYAVLILATLSFEVLDIQNELCNAKSKNFILTIRSILSSLIFLGLLIIFEKKNILSLNNLSLTYLVRSFISVVSGIILTSIVFKLHLNFKIKINHLLKIFKRSKVFILSFLAGTGFAFVSQFIINFFFSDNSLGIFSLSYLLLSLTMSVFSIYSTSVNTYLIKNFDKKYLISKVMKGSIYFSVLITFLIWLVGDPILKFFLPEEYWDSIFIFKLFSFYLILYSIRPIIEKIFLARNLNWEITFRNILFLMLSSIISILLIRIGYELSSIPISYFFSEFIILIYYMFKKNTSFLKPLILKSLF
jgi:O-antigen/teichoic acid export membrane protein